MKELINRLTTEFEDQEYAHGYMEDNLVTRLAAQIYALRKQRGWTQSELAKKSGVAQERISKIESADFDSLTMATLHKFSRAFDVNLLVKFTEFSKGLLDIANVNEKSLKVISRQEDLDVLKTKQIKVDNHGNWQQVETGQMIEVIQYLQPTVNGESTKMDTWMAVASSKNIIKNRIEPRQNIITEC